MQNNIELFCFFLSSIYIRRFVHRYYYTAILSLMNIVGHLLNSYTKQNDCWTFIFYDVARNRLLKQHECCFTSAGCLD